MNINKAEKIAKKELVKYNLNDVTFNWIRSTITFGKALYHRDFSTRKLKPYQLCLSRPLTRLNNEAQVRETILHEIAHLLTPGCKHNNVWRNKAVEIGALGCTYYNDQLRQEKIGIVVKPVRAMYDLICSHHGTLGRNYKRRFSLDGKRCGRCNRENNSSSKLNWIKQ